MPPHAPGTLYSLHGTVAGLFRRSTFLVLALTAAPSEGKHSGISILGDAVNGVLPTMSFGRGPGATTIVATQTGVEIASGGVLRMSLSPEVASLPKMVMEGELTIESHLSTAHGVTDWALWDLDTFDVEDSGQWSRNERCVCGPTSDRFLGGHCKFAATTVHRNYTGLPPHKRVRVRGRVHYLDNWQGEAVMLSVDGAHVWAQSHDWCPIFLKRVCKQHGISVCGRDTPDRLSVKVDVAFDHNAAALGLEFGTNLPQETDPCRTSWGIDDVSIDLV